MGLELPSPKRQAARH